MSVRTLAMIATVIVGGNSTVFADEEAWGTAGDTEKCVKEFTKGTPEWVNGGWVKFKDKVPVEAPNASPECKAEVHKRGELCKSDAKMQEKAKSSQIFQGNAHNYCVSEAFTRMLRQREKAAADKKAADERKAAAEKAELPKAAKRDAAIEKAITMTYKKAFPDAKVLKVILIEDWSTERNDYGVIIGRNLQAAVVNQQKDVCEIYNEAWQQEYIRNAFSGPMLERGAGSLQRTEIVCSKVK